MALNKLTDTEVKNLKAKEKAYTKSDGGGLQILIKPNSTKLWEIYYQSPTLYKRRRTSLGTYPTVGLKEAREKANEYRKLVSNGIDPIDYKNELKQEALNNQDGLFANVVNEWLEIKKREVKNKIIVIKSYQRIESLLLNDAVPYFKKVNIKNIKHNHITKIIEKKNKTAPVSASRLLLYLNKLWLYAISKGYCDFNQIANIDGKTIIDKTKVNHHACIVDLDTLQELTNAIYTYNGHYSTRNILRLVLHLPLRVQNLVTMRWSYIDFDNKLLTIPREEMKVKNENLKDFQMPLTDEVIRILKEQYKYTNNRKYIFVSDYGEHLNIATTNRALQRMGFNDEKRGRRQRTHSFRSTFRSLADTYEMEHNMSTEVREIALDHQVGTSVSRAYTHGSQYLEQLKTLMSWWSKFIVKIIDKDIKKSYHLN